LLPLFCFITAGTMATLLRSALRATPLLAALASANPVPALLERQSANSSDALSSCPGYKASNIRQGIASLTADLTLAGSGCNAYGSDVENLLLIVEYQAGG
jgi:alpha-glucosidase